MIELETQKPVPFEFWALERLQRAFEERGASLRLHDLDVAPR